MIKHHSISNAICAKDQTRDELLKDFERCLEKISETRPRYFRALVTPLERVGRVGPVEVVQSR